MDNTFERFIRDEYEWIYENSDSARVLLDGFDGRINEDEFYKHFEEFMNQATNRYCNDEYYIQMMHENMHDTLINVLKSYLNKRD